MFIIVLSHYDSFIDFSIIQLYEFADYDEAYSFYCKYKDLDDYAIHYFISVKEDF